MHAAARSQPVRSHQPHQCDSSRVRQVLYCQAEDRPVSRAKPVKGYEYDKDRCAVIEAGELNRLAPPSSLGVSVSIASVRDRNFTPRCFSGKRLIHRCS
jgi:non-homologous end joining protein Ku